MRTLLLGTVAALALVGGARAQTDAPEGAETAPEGLSRPSVEGTQDSRTEATPEARRIPVVPVPEELLPPEGEPLLEEDIPEAEPLREVDITDPGAPPIEDAENVIPERDGADAARAPLIESETGLSSPSHAAPVTEDPTEAVRERPASAPEDFAVADMATMDPTDLLGVRTYSIDGDDLGEIGRWVGEAPGRFPEGAVVDVGGLLGIGEREVAVDSDRLILLVDTDGNDMRVYVELTEDQIGELPEIGD